MVFPQINPPCPWLPAVHSCHGAPPGGREILRSLGADRGARFYQAALAWGQERWCAGYPARAVLALARALYAEVGCGHLVCLEWPLPYRALRWVFSRYPEAHGFRGNPRISFQHQADRMKGRNASLRRARAWAVWVLVREELPDLPGDPLHVVTPPERDEVREWLRREASEAESELWWSVLGEDSGRRGCAGGVSTNLGSSPESVP